MEVGEDDGALPSPDVPVCGVHADRIAVGTCGRCGTYSCAECVAWTDGDGVPYCEGCADQARLVVVPWEDESLTFRTRFLRTVKHLATGPRRSFSCLAPGSVGTALGFAATAGLAHGLIILVFSGCCLGCLALVDVESLRAMFDAEDIEPWIWLVVVGFFVVLFPLVAVFYALITGGAYHAGVAIAGGRAGLRDSIRAGAYTQVLQVVLAPVSLVQNAPVVGPLFSILSLVLALGYVSYALYHHAQGIHGLAGSRALGAAAMPLLVAMVVLCGVVALGVWAATAMSGM